jgi:methylisocitrate lyase
VACVEAGADAIFPEAVIELEQYKKFAEAVNVPILANITEFGQTPLFNCNELEKNGVAMVLYPLSAFRAMSRVALDVYQTISINGDQTAVLDKMQSRTELYEVLGYHAYEQKLDLLFELDK